MQDNDLCGYCKHPRKVHSGYYTSTEFDDDYDQFEVEVFNECQVDSCDCGGFVDETSNN